MYLEDFRYEFLIGTHVDFKIKIQRHDHQGPRYLDGHLAMSKLGKLCLPFVGRSVYISPLVGGHRGKQWNVNYDHPYEIMTSHLPFRQSANSSISIPLRKLLKHTAKKTLQGFAIHKEVSLRLDHMPWIIISLIGMTLVSWNLTNDVIKVAMVTGSLKPNLFAK